MARRTPPRQAVLLRLPVPLARKVAAIAAMRGLSRHGFIVVTLEKAVAGYDVGERP